MKGERENERRHELGHVASDFFHNSNSICPVVYIQQTLSQSLGERRLLKRERKDNGSLS
jgi:hypothetical protein